VNVARRHVDRAVAGIDSNEPLNRKDSTVNSTYPTRAQLAASISVDRGRLAGLLQAAGLNYDCLLEKLDARAAGIAETMERLRASIARSRETDSSTLSINGLGELQGQAPELDRLCGEVEAQRNLVRRLNEVLLPKPSTQTRNTGTQKGVTP
jgi:hypothetical protein